MPIWPGKERCWLRRCGPLLRLWELVLALAAFPTCRSKRRGTSVSSTFAAKERHVAAASWAWKAQVRSAHDASGNLISLGTISVISWKTKCSDVLDYSHRTSNCTTTHYTHGDDRWYSCQISCRWDSSSLTTSSLTWDPFVETLWIFPGLSRFLLFTVDSFAMPLYGIDGSENNQTID